MVSHRPSNLTLAITLTVLVAVVLALRLGHVPLEPIFAVPFVLFLPGYALSYSIFGRMMLGGIERLLLSVTASIALAILTGVLLNFTPWGLQANTWLFALAGITLVAGAVAFVRGHEPLMTSVRFRRRAFRPGDAILYGGALLMLIGAMQFANLPAPAARVEGYSSLWILPMQANTHVANVGFSSSELQSTQYRMELRVDGHVVQNWREIVLEPGQSWTGSVTLPETRTRVEALLYRADEPNTIYRSVHLAQ